MFISTKQVTQKGKAMFCLSNYAIRITFNGSGGCGVALRDCDSPVMRQCQIDIAFPKTTSLSLTSYCPKSETFTFDGFDDTTIGVALYKFEPRSIQSQADSDQLECIQSKYQNLVGQYSKTCDDEKCLYANKKNFLIMGKNQIIDAQLSRAIAIESMSDLAVERDIKMLHVCVEVVKLSTFSHLSII